MLNLRQDGKIPLSRVSQCQVSSQFSFSFFPWEIPAQPAPPILWNWSFSEPLVTLGAPSLAFCGLYRIPVPWSPCLGLRSLVLLEHSFLRKDAWRQRQLYPELMKSWGHCEGCKSLQAVGDVGREPGCHREAFLLNFLKRF